ncbi:MAG TPA: gluconate 2-dehydrogenase subunit 3 family protein [Thermodesulfobacteriota bacterium]|nr:gluconate 2-dehydrogenase subunit 3 family protein [Thermodesulfobacteriota bacterium]
MSEKYIYTRRVFFKKLFFTATGSLAFLSEASSLKGIGTKRTDGSFLSKNKIPKVTSESDKTQFKFFNKHQGATVAAIATIIIPTDHDPGANEANVVHYIDNVVSSSEAKQKEYAKGINWIDNFSEKKFGQGKKFITLSRQGQFGILTEFEETLQIIYTRPHYLPTEKWKKLIYVTKRRISYFTNLMLGGADVEEASFFRTIKSDVFDGFYSNPISWKMVNYQGPPQFYGYPDYDKCNQKT